MLFLLHYICEVIYYILLIGNIFNVIANEGLRLNDLQKELWVLRKIDDIVSGLLIVLVSYYVLFP